MQGHSGVVSLEALRWLDRTGITFVHLDHDGAVLTSSARARLDDPRLRRSQALATVNDVGLGLVVDILSSKLAGQARVARDYLDAADAAHEIERLKLLLGEVTGLSRAREIEATAAVAYFAAWNRVALRWARLDEQRIPHHWRGFAGRRSLLSTTSTIHATDPINAMLNYLYALAEAECRRACLVLGLDPGLGFLHVDAKGRDSLALDLIEVVRPDVDAYLVELAAAHVFRHRDFAERDDGQCRILAPLTHRLAETLPRWEHAVAPWAEHVAHRLADTSPRPLRKSTPLTSAIRRQTATTTAASRREPATDPTPTTAAKTKPATLGPVCIDCGAALSHHQRRYCPDCWPTHQRAAGLTGSAAARAQLAGEHARQTRGRAVSAGKRAAQQQHARALGYDPQMWADQLGPKVRTRTLAEISAATGLSIQYASLIRRGRQTPHPKHWAALAALVAAR